MLLVISVLIGLFVGSITGFGIIGLIAGGFIFFYCLPGTLIVESVSSFIDNVDRAADSASKAADSASKAVKMTKEISAKPTTIYNDNRRVYIYDAKTDTYKREEAQAGKTAGKETKAPVDKKIIRW
jgi:hypothetical protein